MIELNITALPTVLEKLIVYNSLIHLNSFIRAISQPENEDRQLSLSCKNSGPIYRGIFGLRLQVSALSMDILSNLES